MDPEFKATSPSEHERLRERTARDVLRIRALNLQQKREWYDALEEGYRLTNDQKAADWVKNNREVHVPDPWYPAFFATLHRATNPLRLSVRLFLPNSSSVTSRENATGRGISTKTNYEIPGLGPAPRNGSRGGGVIRYYSLRTHIHCADTARLV